MAVDLQRARELLLCPREFQLANDQNDVGLGDSDLLQKRFKDTQKPIWDHFEAPNYHGLSSSMSSSSNQSSELASSRTTETETDNKDDDCIAELTQEMTRYMILDHDTRGTEETWDFGGWPYTTQPWSPFGSSYSSTEGSSSQEPTPPATPGNIEKRHVWDVSNKLENNNTANMDQKVNKYDEGSKYVKLRSLPTKPTSAPTVMEDPSADFCPNQEPTLVNKIRAFQLYRMKQELLLRQQSRVKQQFELNEHRLQYVKNKEKARQVQPWGNWPSQQKGSGMRALFLGGSGQKKGSCGTGVFLPRVIGDTSQSRKKKECSPVLIPARVMQALKVHFDRMGNLSRQNATDFPMQHDTFKTESKDGKYSREMQTSRAVSAMIENDMGLPQDWTY